MNSLSWFVLGFLVLHCQAGQTDMCVGRPENKIQMQRERLNSFVRCVYESTNRDECEGCYALNPSPGERLQDDDGDVCKRKR